MTHYYTVPWQNWMAAYLGYTLWMKTLSRGWQAMAHETHTRRRRLLYVAVVKCKWASVSFHCLLSLYLHGPTTAKQLSIKMSNKEMKEFGYAMVPRARLLKTQQTADNLNEKCISMSKSLQVQCCMMLKLGASFAWQCGWQATAVVFLVTGDNLIFFWQLKPIFVTA